MKHSVKLCCSNCEFVTAFILCLIVFAVFLFFFVRCELRKNSLLSTEESGNSFSQERLNWVQTLIPLLVSFWRMVLTNCTSDPEKQLQSLHPLRPGLLPPPSQGPGRGSDQPRQLRHGLHRLPGLGRHLRTGPPHIWGRGTLLLLLTALLSSKSSLFCVFQFAKYIYLKFGTLLFKKHKF